MKKRNYSRIFIEKDCKFLKIANISPMNDKSVVVTLYGYKKEEITLIVDNDPVKLSDIYIRKGKQNPKVTFHQSGKIKLVSEISKNKVNFDRLTIEAIPFNKITTPKRMMEIFIPPNLIEAKKEEFNAKQDIVLNSNNFPAKQWRITLFCASKKDYNDLNKPIIWVNTSEIEDYRSLARDNLVWTWVLRVSRSDLEKSKKLQYFIYGKIKWPKENDKTLPSHPGRGPSIDN